MNGNNTCSSEFRRPHPAKPHLVPPLASLHRAPFLLPVLHIHVLVPFHTACNVAFVGKTYAVVNMTKFEGSFSWCRQDEEEGRERVQVHHDGFKAPFGPCRCTGSMPIQHCVKIET